MTFKVFLFMSVIFLLSAAAYVDLDVPGVLVVMLPPLYRFMPFLSVPAAAYVPAIIIVCSVAGLLLMTFLLLVAFLLLLWG